MRKSHLLLFVCLCVSCQEKVVTKHSSTTGVVAKNAMVVSAHRLATKVGLDILKQGGNAIDAAIAVHYALAVVYPSAGNIGGGGFMVIRLNSGETTSLDFREKAPLNASRDMYLDSVGNVVNGLSLKSHLAVGVPGSVDGMFQAHEKYGSMEFDMLILPAIELAEIGFALTPAEAGKLNHAKRDFNLANPDNTYLRSDSIWVSGDTLVQKDLASTLTQIKENGRDGFYNGKTASHLLKEMQEGGGLISQKDLDQYRSIWRKPVEGAYKSYNIISMGPPSSGGIALLQLLKTVEKFPLSEWGWNSVNTAHLMIEAERRIYADRAQFLGDMDFVDVPIYGLLDAKYIHSRFLDYNSGKATPSEHVYHGKPAPFESEETTHFSIVDSFGNAVSVTTTLNASFGSKIFVSGAGFLLNNEMDDFSSKPGTPNLYGLIGAEANAITPGKRMLSSMTPTIIEKDGNLFMVVGTPGGSTIITSVFQTFLNVVEHTMNMQAAVDAPRFHHQWLPDKVFMEHQAFDSTTNLSLQDIGHSLVFKENIGRVDAILVNDGMLEAGADPRGEDFAAGF